MLPWDSNPGPQNGRRSRIHGAMDENKRKRGRDLPIFLKKLVSSGFTALVLNWGLCLCQEYERRTLFDALK